MSPSSIQANAFSDYPPLARSVATEHLPLLRQLPPVFAAILLREVITYDWKFPAEQADVDRQLAFLGAMSDAQLSAIMAGFASLSLSPLLESFYWVAAPAEFTEKLTAYLWTVGQMDRFRQVAETYQQQLTGAAPEPEPVIPRLCIVVIGKDAAALTVKPFERLRPYGTYFTQVRPTGGLNSLVAAMNARAQTHPMQYAHWYVDGGAPHTGVRPPLSMEALIPISYTALEPLRNALLQKVNTARTSGVVGPEDLRSILAQLRPDQTGPSETSRDARLRRLELSLLTEGSGTQIFSTTFVQWTARELLRRAKPISLMLRFTPRQKERPMNDLLVPAGSEVEYDPAGSLVDADMGAYYTWINFMRLPGAERSRFLAWFEDRQEALVIAPTMANKTVSTQPCDLSQILRWIT